VRIVPVETLCLRRRVHLDNFTRRPESKQDYLRAVREVMARRRAASRDSHSEGRSPDG
jgi:hypothetical protein